jgi:hypothetical protein
MDDARTATPLPPLVDIAQQKREPRIVLRLMRTDREHWLSCIETEPADERRGWTEPLP